MATDRCYYEVLGVERGCDGAALKSAYRKLAKQYHPDANPGDSTCEVKFKEINEAYAVLSDPEKRTAYDRFGKAAFQGGGGGGPGGGFGGFSDIFREFFGEDIEDLFAGGGGGGRRRGPGPERGADLRYDIEITLQEAFAGTEREIVTPSTISCEPCGGVGGAGLESCATCGGRGQVVMGDRGGFFRVARTCPACSGRGQTVKNPCKACGGRGQVRKDKRLAVKIPAGIDDGARIRLSGEGDGGARGGGPGDLYIFVSVKPHQFFERDGADLYCRATVPMTTAALGGRIDIPTIDGGRAELAIPEGAQTGRRFRIKGCGMTSLQGRGGERGDLHVEMQVETPINLSAKQKELLTQFAAACGEEAHPQSHGFFDSVKRFFEAGARTDAPKH